MTSSIDTHPLHSTHTTGSTTGSTSAPSTPSAPPTWSASFRARTSSTSSTSTRPVSRPVRSDGWSAHALLYIGSDPAGAYPDPCTSIHPYIHTALARVQFAQYLTSALCLVVAIYAYSFIFPVRLEWIALTHDIVVSVVRPQPVPITPPVPTTERVRHDQGPTGRHVLPGDHRCVQTWLTASRSMEIKPPST